MILVRAARIFEYAGGCVVTPVTLRCLLLCLLVGCAGPITPGPAESTGPAPDQVLDVPAALAAPAGRRVTVRGYVLIGPDGVGYLCAGLAGSYPPQCGRPALRLAGLSPADLPNPDHASGVTWTGETSLDGTVQDGTLTIHR
jgi:hypothetical protein